MKIVYNLQIKYPITFIKKYAICRVNWSDT